MEEKNIYTAQSIFTGSRWLQQHAVVTSNKKIIDVLPVEKLNADSNIQHLGDVLLVPAFIDAQVYGAYEKLFALYPGADALHKLVQYCEAGGAALCQPTVATNTYETIFACIDAVRQYWQQGVGGVHGLHIEGPWINPLKRGAHVEALIHRPTEVQVKTLLEYGKDVIKMITLAPEMVDTAIIELILSYGVIISAGHSNASYEQAKAAFDKGITTVTHLYNAMSPLQHRAPGLAGAAMDDDRVMASIIPDGHHVDYAALRIAQKAAGQRLFVITDAVTTTTEGYYQHQPAGDKYESAGILSGSALTMDKALRNLVHNNIAGIDEALRMCSLYPAQALRLDDRLGRIATGYNAQMVVLNKKMEVLQLLRV